MSARRGFTLWELTLVLAIMAVIAVLTVPEMVRFGTQQPPAPADQMLGLLHDARKVAIDNHVTAMLRLDPKTYKYQLDTIGNGAAKYIEGTLDMGMAQTLVSDQPRLQYLFRSTGAAFADIVVVRGEGRPLTVRVDPWSGVAHADSL